MPHTVRVRASLARYLLAKPDDDLRRRIGVLRQTPFPPGSRSLNVDDEWHLLADAFPSLRGFIYGPDESAIVYVYDPDEQLLSIELAILEGRVVG
jgi:hypothetical protein